MYLSVKNDYCIIKLAIRLAVVCYDLLSMQDSDFAPTRDSRLRQRVPGSAGRRAPVNSSDTPHEMMKLQESVEQFDGRKWREKLVTSWIPSYCSKVTQASGRARRLVPAITC